VSRILALALVLFLAVCVVGVVLDAIDRGTASPVERIVARARVLEDGRHGTLRVGGTVDSVAYTAGPLAARRDSAQLWIEVDGAAFWGPDTAQTGVVAYRRLDDNGDGSFEWTGRVDAFGLYRADVPVDGMQKGQQQPALFHDDVAFVRAIYVDSVLVGLSAWGAETIREPQADGTTHDVGAELVMAADSTRMFFTGGLREGGGRYVVRSVGNPWTVGANRFLRLEMVRDSLAFEALVP
jgi:hypothetical protein